MQKQNIVVSIIALNALMKQYEVANVRAVDIPK